MVQLQLQRARPTPAQSVSSGSRQSEHGSQGARQGSPAHVAIGIPAYNGARHVADALESARAQRYAELEIVVVDDASTDDTEAVCRRYAALDSRIRYIRRSHNMGAVANFRSVLAESHGRYFTWLAQDDVIINPDYVRLMVEYLESHPGTVACTSDFLLLDYECPGSVAAMELPELRPDRPWMEARKELFRWPQGDVYAALYSMYRREELLQVPMITRRYKGGPTSAWWEMPVLTALTAHGRMVSIPGCLRAKRSSNLSDGWRTYQMASQFDLTVLGFQTKLDLLRSAWRLPVASAERVDLVRLALGNFLRANLQRPYDVRALIGTRRRELARLQATALERSKLVTGLRSELARRQAVLSLSINGRHEPDPTVAGSVSNADTVQTTRSTPRLQDLAHDRMRAPVFEYFRPTQPHSLALCQRLNEEIGVFRQVCDDQLKTIRELHAQADARLADIPVTDSRATLNPAERQAAESRANLVRALHEKEAELQLQAREATARLALLQAAEAARLTLQQALEEKEAELQLQAREAAARLALLHAADAARETLQRALDEAVG